MGKVRDFKTLPQPTYRKITFSLDLFLQLYFKILKLLFLVLKNCDTKSKTKILISFLNEQLKAQKTHTEYVTFLNKLKHFPKYLICIEHFCRNTIQNKNMQNEIY